MRLCLLFLFLALASTFAGAQSNDEPETVLVTYHVKAGQEKPMLDALAKQWSTLRRLQLVEDQPHLLLRSTESGKPVIYEVLTWVTASAPDHVPAEVQAIWKDMQNAVEGRDGRPGIDIRAVTPVTAGQ